MNALKRRKRSPTNSVIVSSGDAIRSAALKAGALPEASDDLILRAKGTFQLNDEGEAVAVDANGDVLFGKDGKTPLTPVEWAESLKETARTCSRAPKAPGLVVINPVAVAVV